LKEGKEKENHDATSSLSEQGKEGFSGTEGGRIVFLALVIRLV